MIDSNFQGCPKEIEEPHKNFICIFGLIIRLPTTYRHVCVIIYAICN